MAQRKKSSRLDMTLMVNNCVTTRPDGAGYMICTDNPIFKEWHMEYRDRYGKDLQQGEPREIYLYSKFHGNEAALDAAILKGVVKQKMGQDGQMWCISSMMECGEVTGARDETGIETHGDISIEQAQTTFEYYSTFNWSFDMSVSDDAKLAKGEFPEDLGKKIDEAYKVTESQVNTVDKLIPKLVGVANAKDEVIKLRALKFKLNNTFNALCMMKESMVDVDGKTLTASKCQELLNGMKDNVKETMSIIAVAQMVLKDSKAVGVTSIGKASKFGSEGFPAMSSGGI